MSSVQLMEELDRKRKDLAETISEIKELEEYGLESPAGHLSFTVLSVTDKMGRAIDAASLLVQVENIEGENKDANIAEGGASGVFHIDEHAKAVTDTFSIMLDSKEVPLKVICHRQFPIVQNGEETVGKGVADEAGVSEHPSVKSVPYTAIFDINLLMKDEPSNTTFTCELEATCPEEPPMILHVKAAFHDCKSLMSSKVEEALKLQGVIQELETSMSHVQETGEEPSKKAGGKNSPKEKKKQKKSKASKTSWIPFSSPMEVVSKVLEMRSYFLFTGVAAAIYYYGEYASV